MKGLKSKKGDVIGDTIMGIVIVFILFFTIMLAYPAMSDVNDDIQADDDFDTLSKATMADGTNRYPAFGDGLYVFVFFMLFFVIIFTSYFIDSSPEFFVIALVVFMIVLGIGMLLANAHEEFMQDPEISGQTANFPKAYWIMSNIVVVLLALISISGIIIYGKARRT